MWEIRYSVLASSNSSLSESPVQQIMAPTTVGIRGISDMTATDIPGVNLRRASVSDLPFIMATERGPDFERFVGRWSEDEHRAALASPGYAYLLGKPDDGNLAGFSILRDIDDAHGNVCLMRIAVTHPGHGFGSRLLRSTVDWVFRNTSTYRLWLDVLEDNARAKHVYQSAGFVPEGVLRRAYKLPDGDRINLITMSLLKAEWRTVRAG
jgi:diamine N-acetyltransferase